MTILLFLIVGQVGFLILSKIIIPNSGYRLATAVIPGEEFYNRDITLVIGDSRIMDGVNAEYANTLSVSESSYIYNLGFNGLGLPDSLSFIKIFKDKCKCRISKLILNTGVLINKTEEYSEFQLFASAYDRELLFSMFKSIPAMKYSTYLFPLIHFNNEVFLRSLYYFIKGKSDQDHSNSYKFKLSKNAISKLERNSKSIVIDRETLNEIVNLTNNNGIELIVLTTPHNGVYVNHKKDYDKYIESMADISIEYGFRYLNHSALYSDKATYFSDLLHLNTNGQKKYTEYLTSNNIF